MAPRRKAARIEAPQTIEEATRLIADYLQCGAEVDRIKAEADAAIRAIEASRDEVVAPTDARMKDLLLQLRTWWAVARADLTGGKKKSIELAGAIIGDRIGNPTLKLPKGMKVEDAVNFVVSLAESWTGAKRFLRTRVEIDKPALIGELRNATAVGPLIERIREEGFRVVQAEDFFIDRAGKKDPDPVVETPADEVVS